MEELQDNINLHQIPSTVNTCFLFSKEEMAIMQTFAIAKRIGLAQDRVRQKLQSNHFDLIVNFNSHLDFFIKDHVVNTPLVRWIHGMLHFTYWENNSRYYKEILSKHDCFISINDTLAQYCTSSLHNLGINAKSVYSVFNPIDIDNIIRSTDESVDGFDENLLKNDYLLQVARLDAYKNHIQLINIYHQLKKLGIREKLYIIGDGENYHAIQNHINKLNLTNDCLLLGERKNPYPFMKNAKLFLHTSLTEGLPTVLMESIACGTPVVAMDCLTGPKEIIDNDRYGVLTPLYDEAWFVRETYELLTNKTKLDQLKERLVLGVDRFSFESIAAQIDDIFQEIINQ